MACHLGPTSLVSTLWPSCSRNVSHICATSGCCSFLGSKWPGLEFCCPHWPHSWRALQRPGCLSALEAHVTVGPWPRLGYPCGVVVSQRPSCLSEGIPPPQCCCALPEDICLAALMYPHQDGGVPCDTPGLGLAEHPLLRSICSEFRSFTCLKSCAHSAPSQPRTGSLENIFPELGAGSLP